MLDSLSRIPVDFYTSNNFFPIQQLPNLELQSNISSLNGKYNVLSIGPFLIFKDLKSKTNDYKFALYPALYSPQISVDQRNGKTKIQLTNDNLQQDFTLIFDGVREDIFVNTILPAQSMPLSIYSNMVDNQYQVQEQVTIYKDNFFYPYSFISWQNAANLQLQIYREDIGFDPVEFDTKDKSFVVYSSLQTPPNSKFNLLKTITIIYQQNIYYVQFNEPVTMLKTLGIINGLVYISRDLSPKAKPQQQPSQTTTEQNQQQTSQQSTEQTPQQPLQNPTEPIQQQNSQKSTEQIQQIPNYENQPDYQPPSKPRKLKEKFKRQINNDTENNVSTFELPSTKDENNQKEIPEQSPLDLQKPIKNRTLKFSDNKSETDFFDKKAERQSEHHHHQKNPLQKSTSSVIMTHTTINVRKLPKYLKKDKSNKVEEVRQEIKDDDANSSNNEDEGADDLEIIQKTTDKENVAQKKNENTEIHEEVNDIFKIPPELQDLVKKPQDPKQIVDPITVFIDFLYPISDKQYEDEINEYKKRIDEISTRVEDVPDDPPTAEQRPIFDSPNSIDINQIPFREEPPKLDLTQFIPKRQTISDDDMKSILYDSLQLLQETDSNINNNFYKIVLDDFQTIINKSFEKVPSESQLKVSSTFNFQLFNKFYDSKKLDDKHSKAKCPFLQEFIRTVQELLISGTFLHRDERTPQLLVQLVSSFFLNGLLDNNLNGIFSEIIEILPPFKEYIEDCQKKNNIYSQISLFAVHALNTQLYLPLFRNVKNCISLKENHYDKTALIWDNDVIEKMSEIIEPVLMYHTFMISPYTTLIDQNCPFIKPAFLYRKIQFLPKISNIDKCIDLIILCISDGLKTNLWNYIESIVKKKIEFPGYNELLDSILEYKKNPKESRVQSVIKYGYDKHQLYNWICAFVSNANVDNCESFGSLLDPPRASLILKSVYIFQPPMMKTNNETLNQQTN